MTSFFGASFFWLGLARVATAFDLPYDFVYPESVSFRAAVMTNTLLQAKPLAYYDENFTSSHEPFPEYRGFQPDLLRALMVVARELDNVTLTLELEQAPLFTYGLQFNYMASDCNITVYDDAPIPEEDCQRLDFIVGDFYTMPSRSVRTWFTPPLLEAAASPLQYVHRRKRQVSTLAEAEALGEPVCILDDSYHDRNAILSKYPRVKDQRCFSHEECVGYLKREDCCLFVDDDLQLKYMVVQDPDLRMATESFNKHDIAWPMNARLDPLKKELLAKWILQAKVLGVVDQLHDKYFAVAYCPIGKAGRNCDQPCSPTNGLVDRSGVCVCDSTRWTGDDCNTEVLEEKNLIPPSLKAIAYAMIAVNFLAVAVCALWLYRNRQTAQVEVAQPMFLTLILLGCLISTSTIVALAQAEDEGQGPVPACMAIPWLYSVGFSITFGTLFAKIRRVWLLFAAAANMQRTTVSAKETFAIVGLVLLVDVVVLVVWTTVDPLQWERTVVTADKYLVPLESQGQCTSEHWVAFASAIASLHLLLLFSATYLCYVSRHVPTQFSEGKYLTIAMVSNLQIFVVGLPILVIIGNDSAAFFVRSVMIFMNDLAVIAMIFGNLAWSVHFASLREETPSSSKMLVQRAMKSFARRTAESEELSIRSNHLPLGLVLKDMATTAKATVNDGISSLASLNASRREVEEESTQLHPLESIRE